MSYKAKNALLLNAKYNTEKFGTFTLVQDG